MSEYSNIGQPMRSISERRLPQWEREALDQWRNEDLKNKAQNPAIWNKLMMIEAKLDAALALLQHQPDPKKRHPNR